MAYLPFYITPEECVIYQEAQEQEIASGDHVISWATVNVEEPSRYIHISMTLVRQ
ncbi:hypothetical protein [Vibrio japonicus]|uniref:hypothetical protein n=1 Tax=Vibrio japonicus TaxID=1824638 RepID=UPI003524AEA9